MTADAAADAPVAPDYWEPMSAWRVWRVVRSGHGYRLASVIKTATWPPGEALEAVCLRSTRLASWLRHRRTHAVPHERCECGIYAAWLPEIRQYLSELSMGWAPAPRVVGQVALWGTVIECERGFRASRAYPSRLYVPADSPPRRGQVGAAEIAEALGVYGVPVDTLAARRVDAVDALEQLQLAAFAGSDAGDGRP